MEKYKQIIIANCETNDIKPQPSKETPTLINLMWGGNQQCLRIVKYLYSNSPIWLPRKKEKAIKHLIEWHPNNEWLHGQLKSL